MAANNLPPHKTLEELVDFFDNNDLGDYLEQMPEAYFDMQLRGNTYLVALEEEVNAKLGEIATAEHVPAEVLVNAWLKEKIASYHNGLK